MASQPTRTIGTWSSNKHAHPGKPDLPAPRRPMEVVQVEKAARVMEDSQRAAAIQVGIQRATCIEHDLAMKASNQTERFKKPNPVSIKKAIWPPQSDDMGQELKDDLDGESQAVDEDETLVNGEPDCCLVQSRCQTYIPSRFECPMVSRLLVDQNLSPRKMVEGMRATSALTSCQKSPVPKGEQRGYQSPHARRLHKHAAISTLQHRPLEGNVPVRLSQMLNNCCQGKLKYVASISLSY